MSEEKWEELKEKVPADLVKAWCQGLFDALKPRFAGTRWEWANAQRIPITKEQNATYGGERYDFDRVPVVASLIFGFFDDPDARQCFVEKNVQTALTTVAFFACAGEIDVGEGGNIIYIMHTREAARQKMKSTIMPIFRAVPGLRGGSETSSVGEGDSTAEVLRYPGRGELIVGTGQTPASLTSTPARVVILDEVEQYGMMGGETAIGLALGRLTAADNGKLLAFSKPEMAATFTQDEKTGRWKYVPKELSLLDGEWVSGDQREFHCPCPHCEKWHPIRWEQIRYGHLNEALPGMPPVYDWGKFDKGVFWECPSCKGQVFEGNGPKDKKAMILRGAKAGVAMCWRPARAEERRESGMYPRGLPGVWSAKVTAYTDILWKSLRWGQLAIRWISAQGDPTKLANFRKEVGGEPLREAAGEDTTIHHLRKLIPGPASRNPVPWRYRDDKGVATGEIPDLSNQMKYVGMTVDRQQGYFKYRVRAFREDGRSYLVDCGRLSGYAELRRYLLEEGVAPEFKTVDGVRLRIAKCFIDLGGDDVPDAYDFCWEMNPLVEGLRGVGDGDATNRTARNDSAWVWEAKRPNEHLKPVAYWEFNAQNFENHLYVERIQYFDPKRYNKRAPALYFPTDIEDEEMRELTAMHCIDKPVRKGSFVTRRMWVKRNSTMCNDGGDLEKMFCVMDWIHGGRSWGAGLQAEGEVVEGAEGADAGVSEGGVSEGGPRQYVLKDRG